MRETGKNGYKKKLKERIKTTFPGCLILPIDANDTQGMPDLLILHNEKWASLETKGYSSANKQPNQEYYVNLMNDMCFSRFIFPENEDRVMRDLITHLNNE